ncbi:hypothetical protein D3C84_678420 [compost metagenome]
MPVAGLQQAAHRAIGGDRVAHRNDGADGEAPFFVGAVAATQVGQRLDRVLPRVHAVLGGLPDIQDGAGDGLAAGIQHPAEHQRGLARGEGHVLPMAALRHAGDIERPEHRGLGGGLTGAVVDGVHQHGQAEHIRQQDEFLAHDAIAHLSGVGEKADAVQPFVLGQLHLAGEGVQVAHQALQNLAQARVGGIAEGRDGPGGNPGFVGRDVVHLVFPWVLVRIDRRVRRAHRNPGAGASVRAAHPTTRVMPAGGLSRPAPAWIRWRPARRGAGCSRGWSRRSPPFPPGLPRAGRFRPGKRGCPACR